MKIVPSALPAIRIRIHRYDVQLLAFCVFDGLAMNIRMLEDHGLSSGLAAASS
jgi:hypothetical protein